MPASDPPTGGRAMVSIFDGTRQPYSDQAELLITVRDGNQKQISQNYYPGPGIFVTGLPLYNNFGDNYAFIAWAKGYQQAGYQPVHLMTGVDVPVDLMLIPSSNAFNFANATWDALGNSRPQLKSLLANGAASDRDAADRYGAIMEDNGGLILACLLNITTAMSQIHLPQGTPLDYIKRVIWDRTGDFAMAQDRFFAWADPQLIEQVKQAKNQTPPEFADAPYLLHPGATSSYKQITFGEANVQLTFHESNKMVIDGVNCIIVEPDIDYYKNLLNHLILEVAVNAFGSLTNPKEVYVLRWIAGQRAGIPQFDPLYTIVAR